MDREMQTFRGHSPRPAPGGQETPKAAPGVTNIQREVEEITEIMRINMQNIVEREAKLSELDGRAENLSERSKIFEKTTKTLKRKQWWKNMKWIIILGIAGLILLLIIALCIYFAFP